MESVWRTDFKYSGQGKRLWRSDIYIQTWSVQFSRAGIIGFRQRECVCKCPEVGNGLAVSSPWEKPINWNRVIKSERHEMAAEDLIAGVTRNQVTSSCLGLKASLCEDTTHGYSGRSFCFQKSFEVWRSESERTGEKDDVENEHTLEGTRQVIFTLPS